MTRAVAGHGALIEMELDPTGAPGVFTTIAELNGDIKPPALSRTATEVTPHQDKIDSHVLGIQKREPMSFSVNWIFNDETHDHETGLLAAMNANETRGYRFLGPNGTANTDEWIMSGQVSSIGQTNPVREGARTSDVTIVMSGPMKIDGVMYGAS